MKAKLLLKIAAIIMLLHAFGHLYGHLTWKITTDPVKQQVVNQMTQHKFLFVGTLRSLSEYYDGYGYAAAIAMLFIVATLWLLSKEMETPQSEGAIKILWLVAVFLFAWGIDELIFFFPFAASFSLSAALLTTVALTLKKRSLYKTKA